MQQFYLFFEQLAKIIPWQSHITVALTFLSEGTLFRFLVQTLRWRAIGWSLACSCVTSPGFRWNTFKPSLDHVRRFLFWSTASNRITYLSEKFFMFNYWCKILCTREAHSIRISNCSYLHSLVTQQQIMDIINDFLFMKWYCISCMNKIPRNCPGEKGRRPKLGVDKCFNSSILTAIVKWIEYVFALVVMKNKNPVIIINN